MKTIDTAAVTRDGDRLHELLMSRRDILRDAREKLAAMDAEIVGLNKSLMRANNGEDFLFPSSDSYMKIVDFFMDEEGAPDVPAMCDLIVKLRRKVPRHAPQPKVIVRHLSDEESDLIEGE